MTFSIKLMRVLCSPSSNLLSEEVLFSKYPNMPNSSRENSVSFRSWPNANNLFPFSCLSPTAINPNNQNPFTPSSRPWPTPQISSFPASPAMLHKKPQKKSRKQSKRPSKWSIRQSPNTRPFTISTTTNKKRLWSFLSRKNTPLS